MKVAIKTERKLSQAQKGPAKSLDANNKLRAIGHSAYPDVRKGVFDFVDEADEKTGLIKE